MARPAAALVVVLGLALAAAASAQPCIPCRDCTTAHCFRVCRPSCNSFPTPDNVIVSGDTCNRSGRDYAPNAAQVRGGGWSQRAGRWAARGRGETAPSGRRQCSVPVTDPTHPLCPPTHTQNACETTKQYCNGGMQPQVQGLGAIGPVTRRRCSAGLMGMAWG